MAVLIVYLNPISFVLHLITDQNRHLDPSASSMAPFPFFFLITLIAATPWAAHTGAEGVNPFSPKASLLRYWRRTFPDAELPAFLLGKASPLNATQVAVFSRYIDSHNLQQHLPSFCASANLYCTFLKKDWASLLSSGAAQDASFAEYANRDFANYSVSAGNSDFTNYSVNQNIGKDTFAGYGGERQAGDQGFLNYESNGNVGASRFGRYQTDGVGKFNNYGDSGNVEQQRFSGYGDGSNGGLETFQGYSEKSNVVGADFKSYGSAANGILSQFSGYSTGSNVITNSFTSYNKEGNGPLDQFTSYSDSGNVVRNEFLTYEDDANAGDDIFQQYADGAKKPDNVFRSYGPSGNGAGFIFGNYGNSSNPLAEFTEYGKDGNGATASFSSYVTENTTFKEYHETTTTFGSYINASSRPTSALVEPGKFFREADLLSGNPIPMPDIHDKMPPRSFLPRTIADKLPCSSTRLPELIRMLNASGLQGSMARTLADCERPPVKDETKRCVTSLEGMAEFAASVLGEKARVSTTANTVGSGRMVAVGDVRGRNGGGVTRAVSCHQSLFPYLVYYCHAVPRVKVYDVEVMLEGKKANQAVAICHLDTTQWSAGHAAFRALGHKPGEIEVCHFIFQNDFIWVSQG
ncbi:polygalacturonase 1 beta-like protein 3 [Nymphaea colorata]|nr:polygalacturonase 1 beta-like protein 3 [Nymphaea colorata]